MSQATEYESSEPRAPEAVFVDLDGSLVATDLLWEHLFALLKRRPWLALLVPAWALRGRSVLKAEVARRIAVDPAELPYNEALLAMLRGRRERGEHLVLATASPKEWADQVAAHLGLFDAVIASEAGLNLKGRKKLDAIDAYNRERRIDRFAYVGDSAADLVIWGRASGIYVVEPSARLGRRLRSLAGARPVSPIGEAKRPLRAAARALRPHQWSKNVLVFVPVLTSLSLFRPPALVAGALAFVAFSLCASAIYVVNDLVDLASDRAHPEKRRRPFASGQLPLSAGPPLAVGLLVASFSMAALTLPPAFPLALLAYLAATLLYSFVIKSRLMIDVITLACLYTVRVHAGGVATGIVVSEWLMAFSVFFFLSLAFVKRYVELQRAPEPPRERPEATLKGRGYRVSDIELIETMGPTAGYLSVLVLALYLQSDAVRELYRSPRLLWPICVLLLYWISRIWFLAKRRELPGDPVSFALRDPHSLVLGVLTLLIILIAEMASPPVVRHPPPEDGGTPATSPRHPAPRPRVGTAGRTDGAMIRISTGHRGAPGLARPVRPPRLGRRGHAPEVVAGQREPGPGLQPGQVLVEEGPQPVHPPVGEPRPLLHHPERLHPIAPPPRDEGLPDRAEDGRIDDEVPQGALAHAVLADVLGLERVVPEEPVLAAEEPDDPIQLALPRGAGDPLEEDRQHRLRAVGLEVWPQLHAISAVGDQPGVAIHRLVEGPRHRPLIPLVDVLRDQAVDRVAHDEDQLHPGQGQPHPLDGPRVGRQLRVVRARLPAEVALAGVAEEGAVPSHPSRVDLVIAEEVGLLGSAHEEARLEGQLLVQRAGGTLHRTDRDEIRQLLHGPEAPFRRSPSGSTQLVQISRPSRRHVCGDLWPTSSRARDRARPAIQQALASQRPGLP